MRILITNDDGIASPFLPPLAKAFQALGDVTVVAPATEQSWIGKGMSRFKIVQLQACPDFPFPAHALDGTPGDCVNIALGHLLPHRPHLVVSGINVGHNTGLAFVAASGTVAGALEGALHGLPALAASMGLARDQYDKYKANPEKLDTAFLPLVEKAAVSLVGIARDILKRPQPSYGLVDNINFPASPAADWEVKRTQVANTISRSLFVRRGDAFQFEYAPMDVEESDQLTDLQCIQQGHISHTILDYSRLGDIG